MVQQQRPVQSSLSPSPLSYSLISNRPISLLSRNGLLLVLALLLLGVFLPWTGSPFFPFPNRSSSSFPSNWRDYSLDQAAKFTAKDGTVIVCAVSYPFMPFLNNWLISVSRQKHQDKVLVIAEDYATLYKVNKKWPGHAVLIPPALDSQTAQYFGSPGFFNFTSRRPQHLLQILELGYNVMYNDVDMVWLQDPFQQLEGSHDAYFTDDRTNIKPLNHSHNLPHPDRNGVTYICSCMIFLRPTNGAKLLMKTWIEELKSGSKAYEGNDQPAFNWSLNKTAHQVDLYLLSQAAFPTGGLYFKNETWVNETKGKHVIIHNNYIVGFKNKMKRFRDFGLWLVDDHALESPLGKLEPQHLLQILELGYNVMYNDVDMVWLQDPFPYLESSHDVYFTDDKTAETSNICSCTIFLRPTNGSKLLMKKWIEKLQAQPWSKSKKGNDQPAFNWALEQTAHQVDVYLLSQAAFPTGGLYFRNMTWVKETKGKHVIIHSNYIVGFKNKMKRFRDFGLWLVDDHAPKSPLGKFTKIQKTSSSKYRKTRKTGT
ncbi:unnamed protein product [Thlaspi arvense]|uniref:Glycosyltransferase n=1 Tax=Thlaspi arvense TaxID=13288 RepID=A0AAU9SVP3_THLAR|nr:unnamed protein product [Thlaspi arvense]